MFTKYLVVVQEMRIRTKLRSVVGVVVVVASSMDYVLWENCIVSCIVAFSFIISM